MTTNITSGNHQPHAQRKSYFSTSDVVTGLLQGSGTTPTRSVSSAASSKTSPSSPSKSDVYETAASSISAPETSMARSPLQEVKNAFLQKEWQVEEHRFADHKIFLKLELTDELPVIEYHHDLGTGQAFVRRDGENIPVENTDPLFYFLSELTLKFQVSQINNHHYKRKFCRQFFGYRHLEDDYRAPLEQVGSTLIIPTPIHTNIGGFSNESWEKKQKNLDEIELLLQFDGPLVDWIQDILTLYANDDDDVIRAGASRLMKAHRIEPRPVMQDLADRYQSVMEHVAPTLEAAIINHLKAKRVMGSSEPEHKLTGT